MSTKQYTRYATNGKLSAAQVDANFDGLYRDGPKPNMVINGSGELGDIGWNSANLVSQKMAGSFPYDGFCFKNAAALSGSIIYDQAQPIPYIAGGNICIQAELATWGMTAGYVAFGVDFLNSSGGTISSLAITQPSFGVDWTWFSANITTPTGTVALRFFKGAFNAPTCSAGGCGVRRCKVEFGFYPSPYSTEATLAQMYNVPGHVNAVNSANLIPNGSGELATYGKNSNNFQTTTASDGTGVYFGVGATISANTYDQWTAVPAVAGAAYTMQGEIYAAGATAGLAQIGIDFLNSSGTIVGSLYAPTIAAGVGWTYTQISGVAPANTVSMRPFMGAVNTPASPAQGFRFRRVKVEPGTTPSTYSMEGSLNWIASLWQNQGQASQSIFPRSIEVGAYGTSQTTIIDFHTSSVGQDYDSRIGATGGSTVANTPGRGDMYLAAKSFALSSDPDNTALSMKLRMQYSGGEYSFRANGSGQMEVINPGGTVVAQFANDGHIWAQSNIQANTGYMTKNGQSGAFGGNLFNFSWTGSQCHLWIDTSDQGYLTTTCDERVKERIADLPEYGFTDRLMQMRVITFGFKDIGIYKADGKTYQGVSAQNLYGINPRFVHGTPDAVTIHTDETGTETEVPQPMHPDNTALISELIGGFKEQQRLIQKLEARIKELENK